MTGLSLSGILALFLALGSVVGLDVGAYLMAASRAQAAADAAALAAAHASDPKARKPGDGYAVARRIVQRAGGARLVECACRRGARPVSVTVEVDVHGFVVPRLAARSVRATATARLVPPAGTAPSGYGARAPWP